MTQECFGGVVGIYIHYLDCGDGQVIYQNFYNCIHFIVCQ